MSVDKGISFPFRFNARGGVFTSSTSGDAPKIRESIRQILTTEPGDRVMEPDFGCRLRDIIFEPLDSTVVSIIRRRIKQALDRFETRAEVEEMSISISSGDAGVDIFIPYTVKDSLVPDSLIVSYGR